jgi:hypothetical protein
MLGVWLLLLLLLLLLVLLLLLLLRSCVHHAVKMPGTLLVAQLLSTMAPGSPDSSALRPAGAALANGERMNEVRVVC